MAQTTITGELIERKLEVVGTAMFYNEQNGYAIFKAINDEFRRKNPGNLSGFTVKGIMPERPVPGTVYDAKGCAEKDPKRLNEGYFFKIKEAFVSNDRSQDGWIEYLCREGPQLGNKRAAEIHNAFGNDCIRKMAESADNLSNFDGITPERARQLHEWARSELHTAEVKQWLYRHGLTPGLIAKIIIKHGKDTATVVKNDTYLLIEINGIAFKTADEIAKKVGLPATNQRRIETGILYALSKKLEEGGHTCVFADKLIKAAQELLEVDRELIIAACRNLVQAGKLCTQKTDISVVSRRPHLFEQSTGDMK